MPSMEAKVLSYGDVLLRQADVDLLTGPYWLNDQIISFYWEYLLRTTFPGLSANVVLLPGCTTYLLIHGSTADACHLAESLEMEKKALILFAVNDNPYVEEANGGSHWTLLAYDAAARTFVHYDSCCGQTNSNAAQAVKTNLQAVLGKDRRLVTASIPRQSNAYDCGMHVLATAATLCEAMQQRGTIVDEQTANQINTCSSPAAVAKLRGELLAIIETCIKESAT